MSISDTISYYLQFRGVVFNSHSIDPGLPLKEVAAELGGKPGEFVRTALLGDCNDMMLAVYPAANTLDIDVINEEFRKEYQVITDEAVIGEVCPGCEAGAVAPMAELYGIPTIVDEAVDSLHTVYFPGGRPGTYIEVEQKYFDSILPKAMHGTSISLSDDSNVEIEMPMHQMKMKQRIKALSHLPPMPQVARELLVLRNHRYANAADLASIIELDPSLSAQLVRYAKSPLYNYRGNISSIRDVIARVLGYDLVMDIALGVTLGRGLQTPKGGPLGLESFWRHSVYTASLAQRLVNVMQVEPPPEAGVTYLCGLLHNFGFLLMGHLFRKEFTIINRAYGLHRDMPIRELEDQLLDVSHVDIGAWLLEEWKLPEQVTVTIREHHNENYQGDYAAYANIVLIASRLLRGQGMGDAENEEIPQAMLDRYGLNREKLDIVLQTTIEEGREALDKMALQLAA
jgi:HD-like signal output (HDOD) protein/prolyl-tRNA editing enzyme YbaK/EbsC (Cys-tRNA(Pro) deacylase)